MAEEQKPKIVLERGYVIPLRRETIKVPSYKKAKKAVRAVRKFIIKHMKSQDVSIGKYLNEDIWKHGIKNTPPKIKVTATKDEKGRVFVELFGAPMEVKEDKESKEEMEKVKESLPKEIKEEEAETKEEEAKKIEKEEIKELKKEHPKKHAPKQPVMKKQVEKHPTAPKGM